MSTPESEYPKPHKCVECGGTILPGERYQKVCGKYEGSFYAEKSCACCAEIRTAFTCEGGELVGNMWDEMQDYVLPELTTANQCFQKLSPAAKEFLLAKWRKWKGLA